MPHERDTLPGAREEYGRRLDRRREELAVCNRRHGRLGYVRLGVAVVSLALLYLVARSPSVPAAWLAIPIGFFAWLGLRLRAAEAERGRLERAVEFYERSLARLDGQWVGKGESGARFLDEHHLYAEDLDLFGVGSVFELLCTARTRIGEETLASWLLAAASPEIVRVRQEAVAELTPRLDLREDLAVVAEDARRGVHAEALAAWGERPPLLEPSPFRWVAWALSFLGAVAVVAFIAYAAAWLGFLQLPPWMPPAIRIYIIAIALLTFGVRRRFGSRTERILSEAEAASHDLALLAGVLERLELERFSSPHLAALRADLDTEGLPPSRRIGRLKFLMDLVDSRHHEFVRGTGTLLLWDIHLSYALEAWRRTSGTAMRRWLRAVGEIEALSSLAVHSYEHPNDVFAELAGEGPCFDAEGLAHPLLPEDRAVRNDVSLGGELRVLVVSGSNMSGKSTLLRTIGVNTVLAHAGASVRARRLRLSPLAVGASIRIQDSLRAGESRFYAEITRLRQIMDTAAGRLPVLFLIDEFLHGTNSHDRRIGAEAIVRGLVGRGSIGLITTHDLALAHIADALGPAGRNVHFEDHLENGRMTFDYHMHPGVVQKSNAIELMRSVGLEV
jgi:hypothetical protein